jgi:hypothetical protein
MSFKPGEKVACVNDCFDEIVEKLYAALPKEGTVYTIREVFPGRMEFVGGNPADSVDAVLLRELKNPKDPRHVYGRELGFAAWRFRRLDELTDVQKERYGLGQEAAAEEPNTAFVGSYDDV